MSIEFIKHSAIVCFLFVIASIYSFAQPGATKDKSLYYDYGQGFFIEIHFFPDESPDSIQVYVFYRISNNHLIFAKNPDVFDIKKQFISAYRINVEFKDSEGIIQGRLSKTDTLNAANYEDSRSKLIFKYGSFSTRLKSGSYTLYVDLYDANNKRIADIKPLVTPKYDFYNKEMVSQPLFVAKEPGNDEKYIPFYLDGNISFKTENAFALLPVTFIEGKSQFSYEIIYQKVDKDNRPWGKFQKKTGTVSPLTGKTLTSQNFSLNNPAELVFTNETLNNNGRQAGFLIIDMEANNLIPGKYVLKIINRSSGDSSTFDFQVIWENMPLSLYNPEYALSIMYYILTDDEYDKLNKGNLSEMFINILNYWQKRDPTPFTTYNEEMNEYFTRVDYAFINFQTATSTDGAKTEMGKIYILHGKPSNTDRTLTEGKATEIWTYNNLKKQFVFVTQSSGEFKLTEIRDLAD